MHLVLVLERYATCTCSGKVSANVFVDKFYETNAYRERQTKNPDLADADEADVLEGLEGRPHAKAAWKNDYDLNWVPLSVGSTLKWFGLHVGMAIRPRHNTAAYWDQDVYGCFILIIR